MEEMEVDVKKVGILRPEFVKNMIHDLATRAPAERTGARGAVEAAKRRRSARRSILADEIESTNAHERI